MKATALVILMLSNDGHWLGNQDYATEIRWAFEGQAPNAVFVWEFAIDQATLADGQVALDSANTVASRITITPPEVRVPTQAVLRFTIRSQQSNAVLGAGEQSIMLYPNKLLFGLQARLNDRDILVIDREDTLSNILDAAHVPHKRVASMANVHFDSPDIILVGENQLPKSELDQQALIALAENGSGVAVFQQTDVNRLLSYDVVRRQTPSRLEYRLDHPVLSQITAQTARTLCEHTDRDVWSLRLPSGEPALEIIHWPVFAGRKHAMPIDAILVEKAVGSGRILMCQIPLGKWDTDPRSQRLLVNVCDLLCTPPVPTLPRHIRQTETNSTAQTSQLTDSQIGETQ